MKSMKRLLLATVFALAASPVDALDVGDLVKFPTDSSFGCSRLEEAREATSHVARNGGGMESARSFVDKIVEAYRASHYSKWKHNPPLPTETSRFCDFFFPGALNVDYRIIKKSDDGYVCLTTLGWDGRCMWVNLTIWNVQIRSN
jgi:hypothetical protein